MEKMTAVDFMAALGEGVVRFSNMTILGDVSLGKFPVTSLILERVLFEGDVDFGYLVIEKLEIYHSQVNGKITGTLKCFDMTVRSSSCSYGSTIPFCFNASAIRELF